MIELDCPWCERERTLEVADVAVATDELRCRDCGTSIRYVDEPAAELPQAA